MKTKLATTLVIAAISALILAQTPAPTPAPAPAKPVGQKHNQERHPQMRAAMRELEKAIAHLNKAQHDYNGHRSKAVDLAKDAVKEIQEGIKSDKR